MPELVSRETAFLVAGCFAAALGVAAALTPVVGRLARAFGAVAAPREDRWHNRPTPLMGGVAIYLAATAAIVAFSRFDLRLAGLLGGGALLFGVGLVDDVRHLRPHTKLVAQILAACLLIVSGVRVETDSLTAFAIPLTVLWVVGITNAFNLLDNMDGLSAGTAVIASFFLFLFSLSVGNTALAVLAASVMGASLGFLIYNFNPARIFMGDSGSMFLGFTLSGVSLWGTREMASDIFFVLLIPAAMMALPIFDTTLVTVMRAIEGRPLSQGGRDHLSHRLVALGLSERQAVLFLYALAAAGGSVALVARSVGFWTSLAVSGVLLLSAILFGAYLAQVRLFGPTQFAEAERQARLKGRPVINGTLMFKRELALAALDFAIVCVAFLGAYLLRFGYQGYSAPNEDGIAIWPRQFSELLPLVLVVKMGLLYLFHAYRGMWRYVGMSDLMGLGKATVVSSAILLVVLPALTPVNVLPRSILVIDWLLFTILLGASRLSFAALGDFFARAQRERLPRVLIVGAGDLGELVMRSIVRAHPPAYQPVAFVDPDPAKRGRSIHGVVVAGDLTHLERLVEERDVDFVVLALPQAQVDVVEDVVARCDALGVTLYPASTFVELHFAGRLGADAESEQTPSSTPAATI